MNSESRIPELNAVSFDSALQWFAEMQCRGLLFHPDDDPADIVVIQSGERMFQNREPKRSGSCWTHCSPFWATVFMKRPIPS